MTKPVDDYLERILTARVYDVAIESPLELASNLSRRLDNQVWLKREDLQPVFSFKLRGAYNKMASLTPAQLKRGVVAASAGNHAQGVALAAQKLGVPATIVMPVTTPQIKINAVAARGARGRAARRLLFAMPMTMRGDLARTQRHLRPPVRRSRRDRRAGHDRHGNAAPAQRARSMRSTCRSAAAD